MTPLLPPGTQIKSRRGQLSKVWVGTRPRPLSLGTGSVVFATMCIDDPGNRANTCCGPVKSSCVRSGKMTRPTLKSDIAHPCLALRRGTIMPQAGCRNRGCRSGEAFPVAAPHGARRSREEEPANKLPPPHSITSSARISSAGGIATPISLATFKFTASATRVGCSIGRSAGLAPLSTLSTNSAIRRYASTSEGP
jgi:hypothetical protein